MHPIIALWAHPRSLSSVVARMMVERGDFRTFHEPFAYVYYLHDKKARDPFFKPLSSHLTSYLETKQWLLDAAEETPVYFKDMCYYISDYIRQDEAFMRQVTHTFIIRHPAQSIPSYYRVHPDVTLEEIGVERQCQHFRRVTELNRIRPILIDAEELKRDPEAMLRAYCHALDIPFWPEAMTWEANLPDDWRDWDRWHDALKSSTGFHRAQGRPANDMKTNAVPQLRCYYEHHLPFYEAMYAHRLRPGTHPAS